jgi:nitric oxide reductase NorE protein
MVNVSDHQQGAGDDSDTTLASDSPTDYSRRLPGVRDFWILIVAECTLFSLFFITYLVNRRGAIRLYETSQQALDRNLGAFNTVVLIVGSWSVVRALNSVRLDRSRSASRYLAFSISCGLTFLFVKFVEYREKFLHGLYPTTNDFFMFYFVLTMIHMVHLIVGTIVLIVMRRGVRNGRYHGGNMAVLESGAIYWHMVDLLWIFLFALLYLLR